MKSFWKWFKRTIFRRPETFKETLERFVKEIASDPKTRTTYERGPFKIVVLPDGTKIGVPHDRE